MLVEIKPGAVTGRIKAPPSKSMAHRLLICAGLCEGESTIKNVAYSEDILATLDCLEALGAKVKKDGDTVIIRGTDPKSFSGGAFSCRESGSTLRFFIPLAMLAKGRSLFMGYGRLMERPMEIYERLAEEKGIYYEKADEGISLSGGLDGGEFSLRGDVSSQFVTGLLFALPLCERDSRIILTGKTESLGYIDMTVDALSRFGIDIKREKENEFYIKGSQSYKAGSFTVEGDCSNAAFLDAFGLLGNRLEVEGLSQETLQGDSIYKKYFELLECGAPTLDVSQCPDLAPVLMALAAALNGVTLTGTRRLKIKESDRGEVMKQEISKFGAVVEADEDEIRVFKAELHSPREVLSGHNDHRVVMSLAVLCSVYGGAVEGAEAVKKSYPDFFEVMKKAGLEVTEYGDK
ncbi:MAG: 3-phosphoshikimate 1-carboxyvinyltransferase [Ruminococcaceae bacterium]|nr:3-phosphoshikimate 1-carboxyvinyltransferase [Oscillospiraceae bacterium]